MTAAPCRPLSPPAVSLGRGPASNPRSGGCVPIPHRAPRLVSFPQLADDVDNWFEPLGVLAVLAEVSVVALAAFALRGRRWGEAPPVA